VSAMEGHWGPPGYHLLLMFVLMWPGSLFVPVGVIWSARRTLAAPASDGGLLRPLRAILRMRSKGRRAELWCLAWLVPAWLVFELVGTKLPHYTMPLYPALALLSARAAMASGRGAIGRLSTGAPWIGARAWAVLGIGLCAAAPIVIWWQGGGDAIAGAAAIACAVIAGGLTVISIVAFGRDRYGRAQVVGIGAAAMAIVTIIGIVLPRSPGPWVSHRLAEAIERLDPSGERPLSAVGFHEDSLVFNTRGRVERIGADELSAWVKRRPDGLCVLPADLAATREALASVHGFNYTKGESVRLVVIQAEAPSE